MREQNSNPSFPIFHVHYASHIALPSSAPKAILAAYEQILSYP
jgi:hypothetical protein